MAIDRIETSGRAIKQDGITPDEPTTPGLPVLKWMSHKNVQPGDSLGSFFQTEEDDHLAPYRPQPRVPVEATDEGDTSKVEAPAPQPALWTDWRWEEGETAEQPVEPGATEFFDWGDEPVQATGRVETPVAEAIQESAATDAVEAEVLEPAPPLSDTTFYNSMVATSGLKRVLPRLRMLKKSTPSFTTEKPDLYKNRPGALLAAGFVAGTILVSRLVSKARSFRGSSKEAASESASRKKESLKEHSRAALASVAIAGLIGASEASTFVTSLGEKVTKDRRRQIRKIGGLAVLAAGTGVLAYFAQRGLHSPSAPNQAIKPSSSTPNVDLLHDFKLPLQAQAVVSQVGHHAHKAHQFARQFTVQPGDGYTQILAKYYKGKSPAELYHGYKEGIKHFGPNFIRGVRHYKMANGDFGLFQGKAHLSTRAAKFFAHLGWRS